MPLNYWNVFGQLYINDHIGSTESWANEFGLSLRVQPFGLSMNAMGAVAALLLPKANLSDLRILTIIGLWLVE